MENLRQRSLSALCFLILGLLIVLPACQARGGISLSHTRVVFDAAAQHAKVTLFNSSDRVYLMSSRVLSTVDDRGSDAQKMPFMVIPPLFRLEAQSRNTVLISRNNTSALPSDRESVFYLSFLAIPSVPKRDVIDDENAWTQPQVSLGVRNIIKLFYRPTNLKPAVNTAAGKLVFSQQGNKLLQVSNPTPYYQTLGALSLNGKPIDVREYGAMIAPFSRVAYPVGETMKVVRWSVIDDYGLLSEAFQWPR